MARSFHKFYSFPSSMTKARWLILAGFFVLMPLRAQEVQVFPAPNVANHCAILATRVSSYISKTGSWVRMLHIEFIDKNGFQSHMVTVWQPLVSQRILMYDDYLNSGGRTMELATKSRDRNDICAAIMSRYKITILLSHYLK